jgi:pentatricopeptide repeat protein
MSDLTYNSNSIDCVLYNCIMDTCIQYRDIDKTLEVYETMLQHDIEPN